MSRLLVAVPRDDLPLQQLLLNIVSHFILDRRAGNTLTARLEKCEHLELISTNSCKLDIVVVVAICSDHLVERVMQSMQAFD